MHICFVSEKSQIEDEFTSSFMHGMADECVLVDNDTSENFMDHQMVQCFGIRTKQLAQLR